MGGIAGRRGGSLIGGCDFAMPITGDSLPGAPAIGSGGVREHGPVFQRRQLQQRLLQQRLEQRHA
jgi:hypothetical protein